MNKRYLVLPITAALTFGLAGCANNDQGANHTGNSRNAQPMGYYSNENHKGNARIMDDNDGPVTEIMDHTVGYERNQNNNLLSVRNGNGTNTALPTNDNNRQNGVFRRTDVNYHGHLDRNNSPAKSSYYTAYEGNMAEKISHAAADVANVNDVRSVTFGNDVVIAVDIADNANKNQTKQAIRNAVRPYVKGRDITVVTDKGMFGRIRQIDNDLRNGGPRTDLDTDMRNILSNIRNNFTNNNNR
ncbi:YhcN/YlaJ family sporulation lipoprotein [Pseudoneobacillus sp. C159]